MNMQQMVQQMQKLQREYEKKHALLEAKEFEYTANDAVKVILKGNLDMVAIEFKDPELLKDDPEMVSDMIKLAYNGCKELIKKEEDALTNEMQKGAGRGLMF